MPPVFTGCFTCGKATDFWYRSLGTCVRYRTLQGRRQLLPVGTYGRRRQRDTAVLPP
jgi:hypothetical protein